MMIRKCKTSDLADGDAEMAWKELQTRVEPKTVPNWL